MEIRALLVLVCLCAFLYCAESRNVLQNTSMLKNSNSSSGNSNQRPRTHIITTAPEIVLFVFGSIAFVLSIICTLVLVSLIIAKKVDGIMRLMLWCIFIVALYITSIAFFLAARNQFVFQRRDGVAVLSPVFVLNYVMWMMITLCMCKFLRVAYALEVILHILAAVGLAVQAISSFSDDPLQWALYVMGLVPMIPIPIFFFFKKDSDLPNRRLGNVCIFLGIGLFLLYMITTLSGHSFGGKYKGLGASDECALDIITTILAVLFIGIMAIKVPQSRRLNTAPLLEVDKESFD